MYTAPYNDWNDCKFLCCAHSEGVAGDSRMGIWALYLHVLVLARTCLAPSFSCSSIQQISAERTSARLSVARNQSAQFWLGSHFHIHYFWNGNDSWNPQDSHEPKPLEAIEYRKVGANLCLSYPTKVDGIRWNSEILYNDNFLKFADTWRTFRRSTSSFRQTFIDFLYWFCCKISSFKLQH